MEQFNLDTWLENKSRKVVTRRGNPVRIICTDRKHGEDDLPIVFLEENNGGEFLLTCRNDGRCDNYDTQYDLFFADEEEKPKSIEIPFGAFDSEFIKDEYLIPEGCEARIEGNKVIIEKIQKKLELTEFESAFGIAMMEVPEPEEKGEWYPFLKKKSAELLDLARKELLKDLPKWKKATENKDFDTHVLLFEDEDKIVLTEGIYKDEYYIELDDLKTLPKEE